MSDVGSSGRYKNGMAMGNMTLVITRAVKALIF